MRYFALVLALGACGTEQPSEVPEVPDQPSDVVAQPRVETVTIAAHGAHYMTSAGNQVSIKAEHDDASFCIHQAEINTLCFEAGEAMGFMDMDFSKGSLAIMNNNDAPQAYIVTTRWVQP